MACHTASTANEVREVWIIETGPAFTKKRVGRGDKPENQVIQADNSIREVILSNSSIGAMATF
jgi:hypothetical protein